MTEQLADHWQAFPERECPRGQETTFVVEVMGFERPDYLRGKEVTHPRMETLGPLCTMQAGAFGRPGEGVRAEGRKVTETIRTALRRRWQD